MKSIASLFFTGTLLLSGCTPSSVIYKENVIYNFSDEGFLAPDMLQTVGEAPVERYDAGIDAARTLCLEEAFYRARERALRVMLHTTLRIPAAATTQGRDSFESDYPVHFRETEYYRALIDFKKLIEKGYIALQDSRSTERCYVVFRLKQEKLAESIRSTKLTFCISGLPRGSTAEMFGSSGRCRDNSPAETERNHPSR